MSQRTIPVDDHRHIGRLSSTESWWVIVHEHTPLWFLANC
jgi:hypothetical protein